MVFYYVLIVSFLVCFCQLVSGATNDTTTAAPPDTTANDNTTTTTTTTAAAASEFITSTSQPIVTAETTIQPCAPEASFIRMTATFDTENSECNQGTQEKFEDKTCDLYEDDGFEAENVNVLYSKQTGKCIFIITVIFGQKLSREDVIETFENATKQSEFNGVEISELNIDVNVDCVTFGEFTVTEAECKKICCEGGGREITLTRNCTSNPANKCVYYKLTKVEKDCTNVCDKPCSGAINNISLMAMLLGAFIHWFLK